MFVYEHQERVSDPRVVFVYVLETATRDSDSTDSDPPGRRHSKKRRTRRKQNQHNNSVLSRTSRIKKSFAVQKNRRFDVPSSSSSISKRLHTAAGERDGGALLLLFARDGRVTVAAIKPSAVCKQWPRARTISHVRRRRHKKPQRARRDDVITRGRQKQFDTGWGGTCVCARARWQPSA